MSLMHAKYMAEMRRRYEEKEKAAKQSGTEAKKVIMTRKHRLPR